jgi:CheY-like chemotaxis protein
MKTRNELIGIPVVYIANDQPDDQYLYRQVFSEACPMAVLYFFMHKGELLEALRSEVYPRPSLLIMDWNMPLRNGYAALSVLAQTSAWQTIPVVIMATKNQPVDEARCQQIGYELVLPKETQYEKLVNQLAGLMQALV